MFGKDVWICWIERREIFNMLSSAELEYDQKVFWWSLITNDWKRHGCHRRWCWDRVAKNCFREKISFLECRWVDGGIRNKQKKEKEFLQMEHVLVLRAYKRIAIIKMTCTAIRNKNFCWKHRFLRQKE